MEKNQKVFLIALIILVISALSFNYMDVTGKIVNKGYTTITVSPKEVKAGEVIYISVKPGKQGVYKDIEFYNSAKDLRVGGFDADVCRSSKCYEDVIVDYKLVGSWDNNQEWDTNTKTYYARVYDIYSEKYVRTYFTVERLNPAAGPAEHR